MAKYDPYAHSGKARGTFHEDLYTGHNRHPTSLPLVSQLLMIKNRLIIF